MSDTRGLPNDTHAPTCAQVAGTLGAVKGTTELGPVTVLGRDWV